MIPAKIQWFIFMSLLVILMLNLLIAMMGDTYAKVNLTKYIVNDPILIVHL